MWGCRPEIGKSEFCGSWKLYWSDGTPLPHDECPMALTLKHKRPIRGMEAIAERPDGTRVPFIPYPTPLLDAAGDALSNKGHDFRLLQDFMGHRDPRHTSRYTRTASRRFEGLWR